MRLNEMVGIAPRYTRSVNLERDFGDASAVAGYVLTPSGSDFLKRVQRVLTGQPAPRAWSITGPYGTGKSAFALFLVNLMSGLRAPGSEESQKILKASSPELASDLLDQRKADSIRSAGFVPILLSGSASPITPCLLESTVRDITRFTKKLNRVPALQTVQRQLKEIRRGDSIHPSAIVAVMKQLTEQLRKAENCQGIVIVADELGKFLEFAAHRPEQNDVFILQALAEGTVSNGKPNFLFVTILHQAFEQYAAGLRPAVRNEWAKVQGRFEDVVFQDPPEETLRVISNAILQEPCALTASYRKQVGALANAIFDLGCVPSSLSRSQFCTLIARCAPLHPVSALVLARLCRKFGQHQRSLFSFLTSRNSNGFSNFIDREISGAGTLPFFSLSRLYDYTADSLGSGLSVGEAGTRWAEITAALETHQDLSSREAETVKAIGLLSAIGPYGELKPSLKLLQLIFGPTDARKTCESLQKRSVLVYRKHSSSFALWQGSDIDIDERLNDAARRVSSSGSLATRISSIYTARPIVAKRHSFATGTLRYFKIRFTDVPTFTRMLERDNDADGVVLYALPNTPEEAQELARLATKSEARDRVDVLVALPKSVEPLAASFRELELLKWVQANTPGLEGDPVARKELRARLQAAEKALAFELSQLFSPAASSATMWFHRGIEQRVLSSRGLSQLISDICDDVYCNTPKIKNELLNRRALSSAAAKARRNLIQAMIMNADKPNLGISGYPPELSMYRSLLECNGLHRSNDGYFLAAPFTNSSLNAAWGAIEQFFKESELQKRCVHELFRNLQLPPFGMKLGVVPVLFCAAAIVHDAEIALYETGAFVPEVTVDVFERLLKSPETFELRSYRIEGVRKEVFSEYAKLLGAVPAESNNLVAIIKPLYRFFNRLQDYTKRTASLSSRAVAIREALLAARDPDQVLFHDLPTACGVEPFDVSKARPGEVRQFFHELQAAFLELQKCYDDLLYRLQQLLFQAFDVKGDDARTRLQERAAAVADYAVEPRMKAFIMHLCADDLEDVAWIEAVGSLLAGKPPKLWNDADRARYEVSVAELSRSLRHIEALVFEISRPDTSKEPAAEVFRIGVTDRHSKELEAVVSVSSRDLDTMTNAIRELETVLERSGVVEKPALSLAALAAVSKQLLSRLEDVPNLKQAEEVKHHDS